jgi:uncharacterized membrane protein YhaH (DUF805 family)
MQELNPFEWAALPLKKFAIFSGRAPRAEYWWFYLGTVIVSFVFKLIDKMLGTDDVIGGIVSLGLLIPSIAVTVRRLHDTDRSGWWLLAFVGAIALLVFLATLGRLDSALGNGASTAASFTTAIVAILIVLGGGVTLLVFMVLPGTEGPNSYGPDPYGPDSLEEVFA